MFAFLVEGVPNAFRGRNALRRWLERVSRDQRVRVDSVNFVLMTEGRLLYFNRKFLHHDDHTDVITFGMDGEGGIAGDVLISYDRVRENAIAYRTSSGEELRRVMVHGFLHLCGHHDKTKAQREAMRKLEDRYLAFFRK